jgi:hypothetical protein
MTRLAGRSACGYRAAAFAASSSARRSTSRTTATKALRVLEDKGLAVKSADLGYFVKRN